MPIGIPKSGKRRTTGKRQKTAPRVEIVCEHCGGTREYCVSELRVRKRIRFCSRACYREFFSARRRPKALRRKPVNVPCAGCGAELRRHQSRLPERPVCSKECARRVRRVLPGEIGPEYTRRYMVAYNEKNRERLNETRRAWVDRNREKRREIQARYRSTHRAEIAAQAGERRARIGRTRFTAAAWSDLKERCGFRCLCCGKAEPEITLEIDHIVAVVSGGEHDARNIQPLCRSCNARKGAKTIDYRPAELKALYGIEIEEV